MTLTLSPEIEARLRERASRDGKEAQAVAQALLADALAEGDTASEDILTNEEISDARAGIRRGLEAAAQGRERPVKDYIKDVQLRRAERQNAA